MFVPVIDNVPSRLRIDRDGSRWSILIPLTIGGDGPVEVAVEVRLWGGHWHGVDMHEFKYAVVVLNRATGRLAELFDRDEAAAYIEPVRPLVLPCVCAAARTLIGTVSPQVIYRATFSDETS